MVAIFSGPFALMGWLELQAGGPEPTPESEAHSSADWLKEVSPA